MIDIILTAAGIPHRETRFPKPPQGTYAVYMDDVTTDGADGLNLQLIHEYTVELYEPRPDDTVERAIEDAIDAAGLRWTKQARYWIQEEQRYQVIYEFTYIEKRRS